MSNSSSYEPPRIERVIDAEELGREVHYAGTVGGPDFGCEPFCTPFPSDGGVIIIPGPPG